MSSSKFNFKIHVIFLVASLARIEPSLGLYLGQRHYDGEFKSAFIDLFTFQHVNIECDMEFKDGDMTRRGHFLVYDSSHDVRTRECYKWCNWSVGTYGLYAYDEVDHKWDYEIPWPSNNRF
ncbi:hypothetical protein PVK06_026998 [Gossypium arboreum]|uniref:S-protein homolog n=1 Tax=Gossypium arboreum TaxID=29729 RepID=A0ABR0P0E5_GOSAR|nr:hypothetical protein PVK06_026998 [Gossypium arboreum]